VGRASVGGIQALNILWLWENRQFNNSNICIHVCTVCTVSSYELVIEEMVLYTVRVRM